MEQGQLHPWDLCTKASMIPRAKATDCHWELRDWFLFVCLFVYSFLLPFFFHWLLKRDEKNPTPTKPNEQCSFLLQGARGSFAFYMPKKWLKQSASHCDIHVCWQCDFSKLTTNTLSRSVHAGKAPAARAPVCSPTWFLPLPLPSLSLNFGWSPWLRLSGAGTEAQG